MAYLLDTNICIYLMKGGHTQLEERLKACKPEEVYLSSIVVSELRYGAQNSQNPDRNHKTLDSFLSGFEVLAYDNTEADAYGKIRSQLRKAGTPIGPVDTFIAAHAVANSLVLVTNNIKHFQLVEGLSAENWLG